jgi:hypothetical protein
MVRVHKFIKNKIYLQNTFVSKSYTKSYAGSYVCKIARVDGPLLLLSKSLEILQAC